MRNIIAFPPVASFLGHQHSLHRQPPMFFVVSYFYRFFVEPHPVVVALRIFVLVTSQLHADLFVAGSHVETNDVFFEKSSGLVFDKLVEVVVLELRTHCHYSVGHRHLLLQHFHVAQIQRYRVGVLGIFEEKHLHEKPFPSLERVPLQTPHVHHRLLRFLLRVSLLVRKGRRGYYELLLVMEGDSDVVLLVIYGHGHVETDVGRR